MGLVHRPTRRDAGGVTIRLMELSEATKARLPNQLTMLRLALTVVFVLILSFYRFGEDAPGWLIGSALLFILAAATDAADGYLARRWKVESLFGRVMDPFCDKVLVMGAFILLAGPGFADRSGQVSGVLPWMAIVMLGRELLVTSLRSIMESSGVDFRANIWGKLKMILQSAVVPIVLVIVAIDPTRHDGLGWLRDGLVWATVLATVLSGVPYVTAAMQAAGRVKTGEKDGN